MLSTILPSGAGNIEVSNDLQSAVVYPTVRTNKVRAVTLMPQFYAYRKSAQQDVLSQ